MQIKLGYGSLTLNTAQAEKLAFGKKKSLKAAILLSQAEA